LPNNEPPVDAPKSDPPVELYPNKLPLLNIAEPPVAVVVVVDGVNLNP